MISGFFDLQVNGYGGIDFNSDTLTSDGLHQTMCALRRDGVEGILATIITEKLEQMCHRIRQIVCLRQRDPLAVELIKGIHVEGPFISGEPGYVGAHPRDAVIPATIDAAKRLVDAGDGLVRMVTLAPESDLTLAVTRFLSRQGIVVSAGHTNASLVQLSQSIDHGLSMFTHLGNGCPRVLPRHDNIIQRALSMRERIAIMFIADGVHVPKHALRNYIELVGCERTIIVSDAIAPAGLGKGRFTLGRWQLEIGDDLVARSPCGDHLVGSAITMKQAAQNLAQTVKLEERDRERLLRTNSMRVLGITM